MINNILPTAGWAPSCRCALCAARRAATLAQALQKKYCPALKVID